jgi:cation diffusion facilitator family transporter
METHVTVPVPDGTTAEAPASSSPAVLPLEAGLQVGKGPSPAASSIQRDGSTLGNTSVGDASENVSTLGISLHVAESAGEHRSGNNSPTSPQSPAWRQDITAYRSKVVNDYQAAAGVPKKRAKAVKAFYEQQNELIDSYIVAETRVRERLGEAHDEHTAHVQAKLAADAALDSSRSAQFAINASFVGNVILFSIKIFAAIYSGSLAVIGSAIDSSLDLFSGSIIFFAAKIAARKNPLLYPVGKTRLEPLAIIVFASVMGVAALQLMVSSIEGIVSGIHSPPTITIDAVTYGVLSSVVGLKFVLLMLCRALGKGSPSLAALAQDHFNDCVTNSATIAAVAIASNFSDAWWLDPAMAISLALLIVWTWSQTGKEHILALTGRAASREQLSVLSYLAMNHDARVLKVDTVRAYSIGQKLLVEVSNLS